MLKTVLMAVLLAGALAASEPLLKIPAAGGALLIDGVPDEDIWRQAATLPLEQTVFGAPFPAGGEMRVMQRNGYLCLSARVQESGRLVARSIGDNPTFWKEDRVVWTVNFKGFAVTLKITVNPIGGYRADFTRTKNESGQVVLAAAAITHDGWSAEAAVPVDGLAQIGFLSAERVRAARPDAPELHWYWPGANRTLSYALPPAGADREAPRVQQKDWVRAAPSATPGPPKTPLEADLRKLPARVWPAGDTKPDQMWETNLRSRAMAAAQDERREWEKVATVADWERFRDKRVASLKSSLGPFPARTPLRPEVTRRIDLGEGFVIENVIFESRPGLVVTANLYLPSKTTGRIPAIVIVHSLHAPKMEHELQDMGMTWARSGAAVLIMDQLGAGERVQSQPWPREGYYSRFAMGMQLYLAGDSLIKWMAWDLMRGIDLLLERPHIDPQRIVMLGAVAGGGDPAAVTSVLDNRIAVALPFNFGEASPEMHYTTGPRRYDAQTADPGWGGWESTRNLRGSTAGQFFPWLICAARAPRPFVFSFEIGWPKSVEDEPIWARYKKVYELYGRRDKLEQVNGYGPFTGPGEVNNVGADLRSKIYPILKRWLEMPPPASEYRNLLPDDALLCLTPRAAAERRPKTAAEVAGRIASERLAAARAKRSTLAAAERIQSLRRSLTAKLGDIEPAATPQSNVLWNRPFDGFAAEAVVLESAPGMRVPLLVIKPAGAGSTPLPIVLALGQGGKEGLLKQRSAAAAALLQQGVALCLADVRGAGETARETARGSTGTSLAATEFMLANTALGGRLKDARTVVRYLSHRADLDPHRIVLWGESLAVPNPRDMLLDQSVNQQPGPQAIVQSDPAGGMLALLTALYEDNVRAVAARGGLVSYLSVLKDRFCYVPLDAIVPGVLEAADATDIVASLAPRGVLLAGLVDGRNRAATAQDANDGFKLALDAYHGASSQLSISEKMDDRALAGWISGQARR